MTDRFHSLTVVLDRDIRVDDVQPLMDAIRQLRGVADVTGVVADITSHMSQVRAKHELSMKLFAALNGNAMATD